MKKFLRPIDLARAVKLSAQQVRMYESVGFIPPAARGPQGYRLYTQEHLTALLIARSTISGFGWTTALQIMQHIHQGNLPSALAVIDARHAQIHQARCQIEETLRMLRQASTPLPESASGQQRRPTGLRVSEAAREVGVRVSAVRFWEEQGLLQPNRDSSSRYRIYDQEQFHKLQVIALLRKAGYGFEAIRGVLSQLAKGSIDEALHAAEKKLRELDTVSRSCIEATAALWSYIKDL